ncbi:MAG: DEAD/DEAH box helicase [Alphaproteobacteria bacterium]
MTKQLRQMMAEIESWESATEFGIAEELWAGYQVRNRSDDLYIAVLASIFDALRLENPEAKSKNLSELAKTLLIYSRSTASQYLQGVDRNINLLYCAATFYLADFPATATLLAGGIENFDNLLIEEQFLYGLLSRKLKNNDLEGQLLEALKSSETINLEELISYFQAKKHEGLASDPRLFIASKLALDCLERFKRFNIWDCLRINAANFSHDVWRPFLMNPKTFPLWELFPSQISAIKSGILSDTDEVYSMQMPTSSGKTSLCEIVIYNEVKGRGKKVLFLVPFRALASEIKEGISKRLEAAGVTVVASHGGNIPSRSEGATAETADVLIITPEKFTALAQSLPNLENSFDTIICDEGHLIDDSSRGLQYELLLTKLKLSEDYARKIVFISAILPNVDAIHQWLGGQTGTLSESEYKPVETDFSFIQSQGADSWQLDFNTIYERPRSYFLSKFITKDDFRYVNPQSGRLKLVSGYNSYTALACVAALKARRNGPVALFTTQKNYVSGLAKKLLEFYDLSTNLVEGALNLSSGLPDLIEYIVFQFGADYSLSKLLKYGIGFHHGDLPQEIRREMERAIQDGLINILICTSTLAEGVNLPIRTLVVHTIKRFNGEVTESIENRSIKNIVGRVGRAGKETRGRIIFANNDEKYDIENVFKDMFMEPASGALFDLIDRLNNAVSNLNIQLSNEIFEAQNDSFLSILDKIDIALIDLIPSEVAIEEIEQHVESLVERTLAYQYCDTDDLKERIKEVFIIRTRHLQAEVPRENWNLLKTSGASPRYWRFVSNLTLIEMPQWQTLETLDDEEWLEGVVLRIIEMPTLQIDGEKDIIKNAINCWMGGYSYSEIAQSCNIEIEDALKLLAHTIGYQLQDGLATLSQLSIAHYGEENISELARNWASLLQYGLGNLQQLDLFERGASDRLGVWGISRYLKENNIATREEELVIYLRDNAESVDEFLSADPRVPKLSIQRTFDELRIRPLA